MSGVGKEGVLWRPVFSGLRITSLQIVVTRIGRRHALALARTSSRTSCRICGWGLLSLREVSFSSCGLKKGRSLTMHTMHSSSSSVGRGRRYPHEGAAGGQCRAVKNCASAFVPTIE